MMTMAVAAELVRGLDVYGLLARDRLPDGTVVAAAWDEVRGEVEVRIGLADTLRNAMNDDAVGGLT